MFPNITEFDLPIATGTGAFGWGTDVRLLRNGADATADTTTITNHGTGGSVTRTVDPFSTSAADSTQADYGFSVLPTDMMDLVVEDTSGNDRDGLAFGVVYRPLHVSSPLDGLDFDGVDRNILSASVQCGVTGFDCTTADGSMSVKATIRRGRTGVVERLAGKWGNSTSADKNYLLTIGVDGTLRFVMCNNAGTNVTAVGTTALTTGVDYDVEGGWDGANLYVKVGDVQEGTTPAFTTPFAPDATTQLLIGAETFNSGDAGSPYPFDGIISDVEVTIGGVLEGRYPMDSDIFVKRFFPAGDHTTVCRMRDNSGLGVSGTINMFAYRVGLGPTRTRTLLDSAGTAFTLPTLSAFTTVNAVLPLPQIILEMDETIQYSYEIVASGVAVTGRTITFATGTQGGVETKITQPGLGQYHEESLEAITVCTADSAALSITMSGAGEGLDATTVCTADQSKITSAIVTLEAETICTADMAGLAITMDGAGEGLDATTVCTADGRVQVDFDDVPEGGGGNTYPRSRVVNN